MKHCSALTSKSCSTLIGPKSPSPTTSSPSSGPNMAPATYQSSKLSITLSFVKRPKSFNLISAPQFKKSRPLNLTWPNRSTRTKKTLPSTSESNLNSSMLSVNMTMTTWAKLESAMMWKDQREVKFWPVVPVNSPINANFLLKSELKMASICNFLDSPFWWCWPWCFDDLLIANMKGKIFVFDYSSRDWDENKKNEFGSNE